MNTRKILFAFMASIIFVATSCTPNTTADEDSLYETEAVDRTKVKIPKNGVDRTKVKIPKNG